MGALFFVFNVFHIQRYAIRSSATSLLLTVYLVSFVVLIGIIGVYLLTVDWQKEFQLNDLLPSFISSSRLE